MGAGFWHRNPSHFLLRILRMPVAPRRENLARIAAKHNQILLPRIWLAILHNLSRFCIGFLVFLLRGAVESGRILLPRFLARCIAMDGIVAPRSQFVDGRAQVQLRCGVVGCTWPVRERQHRRKKEKRKSASMAVQHHTVLSCSHLPHCIHSCHVAASIQHNLCFVYLSTYVIDMQSATALRAL